MDEELDYKTNNKEGNLIIVLVIFLIFIAVVTALFTNYKQETLYCLKSKDVCYIEKTNLVNITHRKKFINYSKIAKVSYVPQTVKGNRFAKGYTSYILVIYDERNNFIPVFSAAYLEKDEIKNAVTEIKKQLKNNANEIKFDRE